MFYKEILPPEQLEIYPYLRQITDQGYVLFGGTALTLQLGHRTSVDFDFFSAEKVNKEVLRHLRGLEIAEVLQEDHNTFEFLTANHVHISCFGELDFVKKAQPTTTPDGILRLADMKSLLITKLKVVVDRVEIKDYRDIIAILKTGSVSLKDGLDGISDFFTGSNFPVMQIAKSLVYFESKELVDLTQAEKKYLIQQVSNLNPQNSISPASSHNKKL
ncbi:nucleotidyl transferase AbiEii/AbiGii toxin family protein [Helicobacter suis]|nr:nucleotidyl transferase AbiEii/AbiGii toxin family protein [Helicobacter suis]BCD45686.1 hypothetical protein NHP190020_07250 [Helicobacter suis]BCD48386.1 hypothetical protein NHP194003_15900 [Helicobacter suis]BCD50163.1 hypothetical protein NHP194004_16100 [Helicobacter suis]BCD51911.1 hypothetical protein NHP194022_15820 [Helicobacter suis]BDR27625.1 hypothetical protein HSHS1_03860 [Helicobacter suis HS1]